MRHELEVPTCMSMSAGKLFRKGEAEEDVLRHTLVTSTIGDVINNFVMDSTVRDNSSIRHNSLSSEIVPHFPVFKE